MRNNPLAIICIFFCLGIWVAKFIHFPLFFVYGSCVLFLLTALLSLKRRLLFSLSLGIAIFLVGFLHLKNAQTYPANHLTNFISDKPQTVYVIGRVVTNPEVSRTFYGSQKTVFTFRTRDLKIQDKWQAVEGLIKVTLYGERKVEYEDELLLQGSLVRPPGLSNPGGFNYRAYLANHNIFGLLKVKEKDEIASLTSSPSRTSFARNDGLLKGIFQFKQKLHNIIYRYLAPEQAALLSAILLGERANLSQDIKDIFINTGTIHILAISGLHVGLIALILAALFRFLRLPRRLTLILIIFILVSYALLAGGRPSIVRATIMVVVILFGLLINREIKIYNSLGLAALLILLMHPQYLFDSGFCLSFFSVISIVYFAPKIEKLFPARPAQREAGGNRYLDYLVKAFSVSLAAWIGIAPLTAYYFGIISPIAILANLLIIPLLFLVVAVGISFLIFAYLWAPLGVIFGETCWLSLSGLTKSTSFMAKIPLGSFHYPAPGIFFFCAYYMLLLLLFNYKKLNISFGKAAVILGIAANLLVWQPHLKAPSDKLKVTFLDVGHGDAIFIEFPYQGTMLIDGGPGDENDAGRWVILPFLWSKGITKIDAIMLTHPDNDHVGGLASVLKDIKTNFVLDNGMSKESRSYNNYRKMVAKNAYYHRVIKQGDQILGFPQVKLFVIHPPESVLIGSEEDLNNNSLVLKLVYKDVSFIFCADIQKEAMRRLLSHPMLESTIIKVPHHGSDEGRQEEYFLQAISPKVAIISADKDNRFGFPAPELMQRLEKLGTQVYTTSDSGAIVVSTDGKGLWVETMAGLLR